MFSSHALMVPKFHLGTPWKRSFAFRLIILFVKQSFTSSAFPSKNWERYKAERPLESIVSGFLSTPSNQLLRTLFFCLQMDEAYIELLDSFLAFGRHYIVNGAFIAVNSCVTLCIVSAGNFNIFRFDAHCYW